MIGLDTNVLVRLLTRDDPEQAEAALALLERYCSSSEPGFVNTVVLCELFWVLRFTYRYTRPQIVEALAGLMTNAELAVEHWGEALAALRLYEAGRADFADVLIGAINRHRGCAGTATFDQKASKLQDFFAV